MQRVARSFLGKEGGALGSVLAYVTEKHEVAIMDGNSREEETL